VVFTAPLATDPDSALLTYQLSGVDKDRFTIDASRNIRFATAPDFEAPPDSDGNNSYLLNIEATDGSLKATQSLVVYVRNVNDAPRIAAPSFALTERGSTVLTKAALGISDQDSADTNLTVTASSITGGRVTVLGQAASTFTVSQLVAEQVVFVHDGLSGTPTLSIRVSDGISTTAVTPVTITYTAIDDAPVINSVSLSVLQGATLTVTPQMFNVTDSDTAAVNVVFNLSGVQGGVFKISGIDTNSFTLADLAANSVTFTHDNTGTSPAFTFSVSDGTNTLAAQSVTGTLSLTNVKPLVQAAQFSLTEATDYTSVTLTKSMLGISDQDNTDAEVTINVSSVSGGNFQKSGSTVTSFTLAEVAAGSISFKHLYGSGTPSFAIQAKDLVNAYASAVPSSVTLSNAPYNLIMGDGSGAGGSGARYSGAGSTGSAGAGDADTLAGTEQSDIVFGDGSGGGAGGSYGTVAAHTAYVSGGGAGSGADQINAGGGDDIVFGDGFAAFGQAASGTGTDGGYGGGGGGGHNAYNYSSAPKGGFGAGAGGVASNPVTSASQGGSTVIHHAGAADVTGANGGSGSSLSSGGGGAGVGNASTGVIANAITQTQYQTVFNDVSRGAGADARVFNQAMGTGADLIDAGDGNDWVFAGGGNDTITGGKGSDRLFTGFGADTLNYNQSDLDGSTDLIADFNPNAGDKLKFDFIPPDQVKQYLSMQSWGGGQRLLVDKDGGGDFANPEQVIQIGFASTASIASVTNGAAYTITINYKDAAFASQTKTYTRTANTPSASLAATNLTEIMQSLVTQINADASLTNTYATFEGGTFQFARVNPSNTLTQPVISFSSNIQPVVSALNNSTQPDSVTFNALLLSGAISLGTGTLPALSPELNLVEGQTLTLSRAMLGLNDTVSNATNIQVRNVQNGYFAFTGTNMPISSFTLAQLANVVFVHDGSEAAPQFEMRSDALSSGTFPNDYLTANINFQKVNDAPVFLTNRTTKIINAGESLRLTEADLGNVSDPDTIDTSLIFNISLPTTSLKVVNADTGDLSVTSFTLADVKNNKISLQAINSIPLATYQAPVTCADGLGGTTNLNLSISVDMPGRQKAYIKSLVVIMNSDLAQVMTTDDLSIIAPDSSASDLLITVDVSSGLRFLNTNSQADISQFSYQEVIDGKVSIKRKSGTNSIDTSLVKLRLEDQSDTTHLVDYYDAIVNTGLGSMLFGDESSSSVVLSAGVQTQLNWEAMGMRIRTAKMGVSNFSNNYYHANSSGQQVGTSVFLSNSNAATSQFTQPVSLTSLPNVPWGYLNFYNDSNSGNRTGWAAHDMPMKYLVDYAGADAPIVMSAGFTAIRGQSSLISPTDLDIRDADSPASQILVNIRNVKNGRIELVTDPNTAVNKFTMQDVYDGKVLFRHDGSNLTPSFEMAVTNPGMHNGVNLYFNKAQGKLISNGVNLPPSPDWLNLAASLRTMTVDLDSSPENVTVTLSNIQGMSGYAPGSSPLVFTWRDFTEKDYFSGWQTANGAQMIATLNDGNSSVSAEITINTRNELTSYRGMTASIFMSEEGGRNLVNPALFKFTQIAQNNLANFSVDATYGMHLELLSNPGVSISTFNYRQLDGGQLVAVYDGNGVVPQMSISLNQSFTSGTYSGNYVSVSKPVTVLIDRTGVDDAPQFSPAFNIGAGQSRLLYSREFNVLDAESYASGDYSGLVFKVKATEGVRIERVGTPGIALTQFTYSELDQGLIKLVSLGDAYPVLQMTVSNPDGSFESSIADVNFGYQKGTVNDAPVFSLPATTSVIDQGGSLQLTEQMLGFKDIDSSRSKVTLNVTDTAANMHGVFKIADHITTSFTLSQLKSGLVSFVHDGSSAAPVMSLSASDESTTTSPQTIPLQLTPSISPPSPRMTDVSGALIIFGDGSGSGGFGARYTGISTSRAGLNGAGDNDNLTGSSQADVIFGDGSGGGEGACISTVGIGGGAAGSGNDTINAGDGSDIIFGDGFWGDISSQSGLAGSGGYGGGGGGGLSGAVTVKAGLGGIGAGDGTSYNSTQASAAVGSSSTLFNSGGSAQSGLQGNSGSGTYAGGGGAGVNTRSAGDTLNIATNTVIQTNLTDANYLKILNDVTGGPNADQRVFNQAMGNGNDLIDAGGGNDWVLAGGGNDTITGGTGSDVIWGGLGADSFKFNLADFDRSRDVIKDFSKSQNDRLFFSGITSATLDQYVNLETDVSANKTTLQIDTSGTANFTNPTNSIVLENSTEFLTLTQLKSAIVFM
jgi:hypothetical protein